MYSLTGNLLIVAILAIVGWIASYYCPLQYRRYLRRFTFAALIGILTILILLAIKVSSE